MSRASDFAGQAGGRDVLGRTCEVAQEERRQLLLRRQVQGLEPLSDDGDVVGLALSGGGVRSGAVSLGVLQGLDRRGVLPYVDYLSTVSGGGYAGAYLSSVGVNAGNTAVHPAAVDGAAESNGAPAVAAQSCGRRPMLPITSQTTGVAPQRMKDFVHGGHFLRRSSAFANRYAIGLLQIWMVVFSGLLAVTSLTVWTFKLLDRPGPSEFLIAMGFEGDISQAFFPSFILLVLWIVAWLVSYFREQGRANGTVAQYVFYLMILVTVVAVASLLGTGDIALSTAATADGSPPNEGINTATKTILTVLVGAIAAALLPYLNPKRLLHSGTSPESKPVERYVFWLASRALLFGVPFLFIAFFARENISGWNERRDASLYTTEINDWNRLNPNSIPEDNTADSSSLPLNLQPPSRKVESGHVKWWNDDYGPWTQDVKREASLEDEPDRADPWVTAAPVAVKQPTGSIQEDHGTQQVRVTRLFGSLEDAQLELDRLDSPMTDAELAEEADSNGVVLSPTAQRVLGSERLSLWRRWGLLGELALQWSLGSREDWEQNRLRKIWLKQMEIRRLENTILAELNGNLAMPDFYKRFSGVDWKALGEQYSSESAARLRRAYERAELVYALHKDVPALTPREKYDKLEQRQPGADEAKEPPLLKFEQAERERMAAHRALLTAYYKLLPLTTVPVTAQANQARYQGAIQDKSTVYATVVLEHDQPTRLTWFWWSAGIFLVAGFMVSLNATSWHGYYATRLADMWIEPVPGAGRSVRLAALQTAERGYPIHLINGTVQLMGRQNHEGRRFSRDHFLLSELYCGSDRLQAFCPTSEFMDGSLTLADAIAISGGAFTPTQTRNPLLMALLVLGNLRLGQWLENPRSCIARSWLSRPLLKWLWVSPLRLMAHWFQRAERRPFCFVTDGGHHENLGIEPLLKRRCRLIIACDVGQDETHRFLDFAKLLGRIRLEEGIELRPVQQSDDVIKLDLLVPDPKQRYTKDHFLIAEIVYPDRADQKSYLIYMKSSLTGDEPTDLVQYHRSNDSFPHDPTADQFYEPDRFAAYAQLGFHIAEMICRRLPQRVDGTRVDELIDRISGAYERRQVTQCDMPAAIIGAGADGTMCADGAFEAQDGSFATSPCYSVSGSEENRLEGAESRQEAIHLRESVNRIAEEFAQLRTIIQKLLVKLAESNRNRAAQASTPAEKATTRHGDPLKTDYVGIGGELLPFTDAGIENVPRKPGVFELRDSEKILYYGSSANTGSLRVALERQRKILGGLANSFKYELVAQPKVREEELLAQHKEHFGELPRYNASRP